MSTTGSIGGGLILSFFFLASFPSFFLSPVESGETESLIDVSLRNFLQSHNKMLECFFFWQRNFSVALWPSVFMQTQFLRHCNWSV